MFLNCNAASQVDDEALVRPNPTVVAHVRLTDIAIIIKLKPLGAPSTATTNSTNRFARHSRLRFVVRCEHCLLQSQLHIVSIGGHGVTVKQAVYRLGAKLRQVTARMSPMVSIVSEIVDSVCRSLVISEPRTEPRGRRRNGQQGNTAAVVLRWNYGR